MGDEVGYRVEGSDRFLFIDGRCGGPEEASDQVCWGEDEKGNVLEGADRFFVISGRCGGTEEAFLDC